MCKYKGILRHKKLGKLIKIFETKAELKIYAEQRNYTIEKIEEVRMNGGTYS